MADGCYKNPYFPASFKGVPFEAMEITTEVGRRIAKAEFPFSEITATEDMGRRMRNYKLSARFVDNDHVVASSALLAACESFGTGLLIHPTFGAVLVKCESASLKDNPLEEQGMTTMDLNFVEAEEWANGLQLGASVFTIALDVIFTALQTTFYESYQPSQSQFYYVDNVLAASSEAVFAVETEFEKATVTVTDAKVYSATAQMRNVRTDVGMLNNAETVWQTVSLGMAAVYKYTQGLARFTAFRNIANAVSKTSSLTGIAAQNQNVVYTVTRILAAAYMARSLTETTPTSIGSALQQYDIVISVLDQEYNIVRETCDADMQLALGSFITQVTKALLYRAYSVPPTISYNFSSGMHALVAAYEIYGDARRVRDVVARNNSSNPHNMGPIVSASL